MLVVELEGKLRDVQAALQVVQKTLKELDSELSVVTGQKAATKEEWEGKVRTEKLGQVVSLVALKQLSKNLDTVREHHNKCICLERALVARTNEVKAQQVRLVKEGVELEEKIAKAINNVVQL